jgi:hypothetical protein
MNVIGQIQDPSIKTQIQVGNAVCLLRPCSMFLLRTELSSGKLHIRFPVSYMFIGMLKYYDEA